MQGRGENQLNLFIQITQQNDETAVIIFHVILEPWKCKLLKKKPFALCKNIQLFFALS